MSTATRYLLDTNIISEASKPRPAPSVVAFLRAQLLENLYLSAITMGELELGVENVTDPARRAALRHWLSHHLLTDYAGRILPIDEGVMVTWSRMVLTSGKKPGQLPCMDALLAATALHHGLTLVTRNTADFAAFKLNILNPWEATSP